MGNRRARWLVVLTLLAAAAAVGAGCGDSDAQDKPSAQEEQGAEGAEAPEQSERSEAASAGVPGSLGELESGAEDAIDFAREGARAQVVKKAHAVRVAALGPAPRDLRAAGVPAARIEELQRRAQELESLAARADLTRVSLAANRISGLMPEFYARFRDPVPPEVLKLDYLDREAQLRSLAGDRASIPAAVRELSATWEKLRPDVVGAGGERVAARYARHVRRIRRLARGSDDAALQQEAGTGLELVDQLERQFRQR